VLAIVRGEVGGLGDIAEIVACLSAIGSFLAAVAWARHACVCYSQMMKRLGEQERKMQEIQKEVDEIRKLFREKGINAR